MDYTPILLVNLFLFGIGLVLLLIKKSVVFIIIGMELLIHAAISNYVVFNSQYTNQLEGQVMAIFIIATSICEIVVFLAIGVQLYQQYRIVNLD